MRILFFSSIFPQPHNRMRGIYCLRLCKALACHHEVKVISPWSWVDRLRHWRSGAAGDEQLAAELGGLEVHYPRYCYPPKLLRGTYGWFMWASARRHIRRLLDTFEPECIVSYWTHPDGAVAIRAARLAGVPATVMVGGSDALLMAQQGGRGRQIVEVLQAADAVVTVGRDLREKVLSLGIKPGKVHVVARGIDTDLFSPAPQVEARRRLGIPEEGKILLWVGNMVPLKGLDVLLEACSLLAGKGEAFRLFLIGHGPQRRGLETEWAARGLSHVVSFV